MGDRTKGRGAKLSLIVFVALSSALASSLNCSTGPRPRVRTGATTELSARPALPNARSPLGTNLAAVVDWTRDEPFVDAHRMARAYLGGSGSVWEDDRALDKDARGWVQRLAEDQVARTLVFTDSGTFRAGRYIVSYRGSGALRPGPSSARRVDDASAPGRMVVDLDPARGETGLSLEITAIDPDDPLRDIRIVPDGGACEGDHARYCDAESPCPTGDCLAFEEHHEALVFHPDFLSRLRGFGMLRFMDFTATNDSPVERWEERPVVDDATWTIQGAPIEVAARLSNQLGAHPWFCVPHRADDAYVRQMAELLRDEVDPGLQIWIEYSNEVWNTTFEQHRYASERGLELGLDEDPFVAALRFYARRSVEVFRIFSEVIGSERLVRVLASQAANTWATDRILEQDGAAEHADALAIAPYFGWSVSPDEHEAALALDLQGHLRDAAEVRLPMALEQMREHARVAARHRLELVAYEAGQHYVGVGGVQEDERLNARFDALNRHPEMRALYRRYLEGWREAGGHWLNHFTHCERWTKWGRWGALEHVRQPREEAPKYDALMSFIDDHPRWW